jgi:phage shock protein PspC (stress-responsive transcriptional regulator)
MNKIIQINLAGQAVSIDEQAYSTLSQYMMTLEKHFKHTESGKEILDDIEARIAELFFGKLKNSAFINETHVQEAITLMGTAQDLGADEGFEPAAAPHYTSGKGKKLFRDKEDSVLGGVCSGLGAYFGLDASMMRVIFVLLVLLAGAPIIAYIVLWAVLPAAITPQDRYRMHGDASTITDIANNIREEANRVSHNLRDGAHKWSDDLKKNGNLNYGARNLAKGIEEIVKVFGKIFGAFVLTILVIVGMALAVALLTNATGGFSGQINGAYFSAPTLLTSPTLNWVFSISLLSLILIPIGTVIYAILQFIFSWVNVINLKGLFLAWLACLAIFIGVSIYAARDFNQIGIKNFILQMDKELDDAGNEIDAEWNNGIDHI